MATPINNVEQEQKKKEVEWRREWGKYQPKVQPSLSPNKINPAIAPLHINKEIPEELPTSGQQQKWQRELSQGRMSDLRSDAQLKQTYKNLDRHVKDLREDLDWSPDVDNLQKILRTQHNSKERKRAIQQSIRDANIVKSQAITSGGATGFLLTLSIAIVKDYLDILVGWLDLGTISSTILSIVVSISLWIIIRYKMFSMKRYIVKYIRKRIWRYLTFALLDFIPILSIYPGWTISVLLLKRDVNKKTQEAEEKIRLIDEEIRKLQSAI